LRTKTRYWHEQSRGRRGPPRKRVLTDHELRAIWNGCQDDDFGRIVRLLMLTACRREEIGSLERDRFRPRDAEHPGHPYKKPRAAEFGAIAYGALDPPGGAALGGSRVCLAHPRSRFSAWSYSTLALHVRITKAQGKALVPWRIHDLRRSVAIKMADDIGVLPHVVEAILNHLSGHKGGVAGIQGALRA
jgi:integrase